MSALLATAEPRHIKASHRRRRRCTTGHRQYANNNPYKFTDPDGRIVVAIPIIIEVCAASVACATTVIGGGLFLAKKAGEALTSIVKNESSEPTPVPTNDDNVNDLINSGTKEGESSTTKISRPGGEEARNKEFGDLGLNDVEDKGNGVKVGETDSGRRIVSRPSTEDGRPTIEVQRPDGKSQVKIRYDDE